MNRRRFIQGSLTLAGLCSLGCRQAPSPASPVTGQRKDPNFKQGHRLRKEGLPTEPSRVERCKGVILGGGISGLSAGWRWSHAGLEDYRLLELEKQFGGNSRALDFPPTSAPIAAHYLPIPNREARAVRRLLREMELLGGSPGSESLDERHLCHSRQERLHYLGAWYEGLVPKRALSEESLQQWDSFQEHILAWRSRRDSQGRKVFALPLHYSSREEEFLALDKVSFAHYAQQQGWTDPFLQWMLNYACRDDFGGTTENCSAWAGLHYFASRDGGGLGDPDNVLVWPEGNNRLARFLEQKQTGKLRGGALVTRVAPSDSGVTVDYLELESGDLVRLEAEVGVFCLPAFVRRRLVSGCSKVDGFVFQPWVTANLFLDKMPEDQQGPGNIAWDNVVYGSQSLGYVVATRQSLNTDPTRPTVWTWYRPFPERPAADVREELLESSWEHWKETVLLELEDLHPDIRKRCRRLDVTVLGHGMIRPSVGFIWGAELAEARQAQGRLFYGHGELSGMSLFEESQFRGVAAAEEALGVLNYEYESFL